jgi:hypothetical protein
MDAHSRKALGCAVLLIYLGVYALAAASLGAVLAPLLPAWGELAYYAVAGTIWVLPFKPLFGWLNRGG